MKNIFYSLENQVKKVLYKKYLLKKDVQMAVQSNDIERVLRMVPKHSKDLFLKELKKHASKIAN